MLPLMMAFILSFGTSQDPPSPPPHPPGPKHPVVVKVGFDDKSSKVSAKVAVGDTLQVELPFLSNGYIWELSADSISKSLKRRGDPKLIPGCPGPDGKPAPRSMVFAFEAVSVDPTVRLKFEYVRRFGGKRSEPARTVDALIRVLEAPQGPPAP